MPEYRRFIAYFYEYINGKKQKNVGFAKVELRSGMWRILFRLMADVTPQPPVQVYGFVRESGYLLGVPMGTMRPGREMAEEWAYRAGVPLAKKYRLEDLSGIWIQSGEGRCFLTVWDDEPIEAQRLVMDIPETAQPQEANSKSEETLIKGKADSESEEILIEEKANSESKEILIEGKADSESKEILIEGKADSESEEMPIREANSESEEMSIREAASALEEIQPQEPRIRSEEPEGFGSTKGSEPQNIPDTQGIAEDQGMPELQGKAEKQDMPELQDEAEKQDMPDLQGEAEKQDMPELQDEAEKQGMPDTQDMPNSYNEAEASEKISQQAAAMKYEKCCDEDVVWELLQKRQPFLAAQNSDFARCVRIMPCDVVRLQQEGYQAGRSSFLQHAFYQYRHLLLAVTPEGEYVLGVPGLQNPQEQYMAEMFGYRDFRLPRVCGCGRIFGYWCRSLCRE